MKHGMRYHLPSIAVLLAASAMIVHAQTPNRALDQIALARQFAGLWRMDFSKDTSFFLDIASYGDTGLVASSWYATRPGQKLRPGQRLYGYDRSSDKYFVMLVAEATGRAAMAALWFTSDHQCEGYNYRDPLNPSGSISRRFVVGFTTPDDWVQKNTYPTSRPPDTETFHRVKR